MEIERSTFLNPEAPATLAAEKAARRVEQDEARRLRRARLTVCGVGGLGEAFVSEAFLRGFRDFTLVDADRVRRKNLRRAIWYGPEHVGSRKVDALAAELLRRDPSARVTVIPVSSLSPRGMEAVQGADVVVAAFDNNFSRYHLQAALVDRDIPLLDLGAEEDFDGTAFAGGRGQLRLSVPGGPCLLCMGLETSGMLDPDAIPARRRAGYIEGMTFTPRRVRGPNAVLALAGVDVLIDWFMGRPAPRYLAWDGRLRRFREIVYERPRPDCPLCRRGEQHEEGSMPDLAALRGHVRSDRRPGRAHPEGGPWTS